MIYPKIHNVRLHLQPGERGVQTEHLYDREYALVMTFLVLWKIRGAPKAVRIGERQDFTTDFASIPRLLRAVFDTNGRNAEAAVAHDYFYQFAHLLGMTRYEADKIFYLLLRRSNVGRISAYTQFAGVRLGGWVVWMRHPGRTWKSAL